MGYAIRTVVLLFIAILILVLLIWLGWTITSIKSWF